MPKYFSSILLTILVVGICFSIPLVANGIVTPTPSTSIYRGPITVDPLNGGEPLVRGESYYIRWRATGSASSMDQVSIRLVKTSNLATISTISSAVSARGGNYLWTVPMGIQLGSYKIVVSAMPGNPAFDYSSSPFSIVVPLSLTFTVNNETHSEGEDSPNTVRVPTGTRPVFAWSATTAVFCSSSGGSSNWAQPSRPIRGSTQLLDPVTTSGLYTLSCINSAGVSATNNIQIKVMYPSAPPTNTTASVSITSPKLGETLTKGKTHDITWTSDGLSSSEQVTIWLTNSSDGTYVSTISSGISPTAGLYSWIVPSTIKEGGYKIEFLKPLGSGGTGLVQIYSNSNPAFSIVAPSPTDPSIILTTSSIEGLGGSVPQGFTFTKDLTCCGTTDPDVVELKSALSALGCFSGLNGIINGYFGTTTKSAVICFQNKFKDEISIIAGYPIQATGFLGVATREFLNSLIVADQSSGGKIPTPPATGAPSIIFTANFKTGAITVVDGTSLTMVWDTYNAASCYAVGGSSSWAQAETPIRGRVYLINSVTTPGLYTLTCYNSAGASTSKSVKINVTPPSPDTCPVVNCLVDNCPGQHFPDANGCTNCSSPCQPPIISLCQDSNWSSALSPQTCPVSGQQTKTWTKVGTCSGGVIHPSSETVSCNPGVFACTSFTYTAWSPSTCPVSGIQTRTVSTATPLGCTGGSPVISQTCVPSSQSSITITSPNGGESWVQGSNHAITWISTGLSASDYVTVTLVNENTPVPIYILASGISPLTGSYSWTVPTTVPVGSYKFGICKYVGAICVPGDYSNNSFNITASGTGTPTITFTANGSANSLTVASGATPTFTWSTTNASSCYSSGGTSDWTTQPSRPTSGSGQLLNPITASALYTLSCYNSAGGWTSSSIQINISGTTAPSINVTSPNGGETWVQGSTHIITWTAVGLLPSDYLAINLVNPNTSSTAYTLTSGILPSAGSYSWTVPVWITTGSYKIMIFTYKMGAGNITGYSNNSFSVPMTFDVSCSASPSSIGTGQSTTFTSLVSGGTGSYTYSWSGACTGTSQNCSNTFSNSGTQTAALNVSSGGQTKSASCSVGVGTGQPTIVFTANGSANSLTVAKGAPITFAWSTTNAIFCSSSRGTANWPQPQIPTSGSIQLSEPPIGTVAGFYTLSCISPTGVSTSSSIQINMAGSPAPSLTVFTPNGGESLVGGSTYTITWAMAETAVPAYYAYIFLHSGTVFEQIVAATENDGSYSWQVPTTLAAGADYTIEIRDASYGASYWHIGFSNPFSIGVAVPLITLTSPNGGESWQMGETHRITWQASSNIQYIELVAYNGSLEVGRIARVPASAHYYDWTVNGAPSSSYKVYVYGLNCNCTRENAIAIDVSDNYFSILSPTTPKAITVTAPYGLITWTQGQTYNINWTSAGLSASEPVTISLVNDPENSSTPYTISSSVSPLAGSYSWTIPATVPAGYYTIRVSRQVGDTLVYGDSNSDPYTSNYLHIIAQPAAFTFTANGVENSLTVLPGATPLLAWSVANAVFCSSSGPANWTQPSRPTSGSAVLSVNASGLYTLSCISSAGASTSKSIQINVSGGTACTSFTYSNWSPTTCPVSGIQTRTVSTSAPSGCTGGNPITSRTCTYSAQPSITVTSPNGGETLTQGQPYNITWASVGLSASDLATIRLVDANTLLTISIISSGASLSAGSYPWTVPTTTAVGSYKILLYRQAGSVLIADLIDYSDSPFNIIAPLTP